MEGLLVLVLFGAALVVVTPLMEWMDDMGYLSIVDMLEQTDRESALRWHLNNNHYPPVPESMIPAALEAIDLANDMRGEEMVQLPDGIQHLGRSAVPAYVLVDSLHLGAFLDPDDDPWWEDVLFEDAGEEEFG